MEGGQRRVKGRYLLQPGSKNETLFNAPLPRIALAPWPPAYLQPCKQGSGKQSQTGKGGAANLAPFPCRLPAPSRLSWSGEGNEMLQLRVLTNILAQILKFQIGTVFHLK